MLGEAGHRTLPATAGGEREPRQIDLGVDRRALQVPVAQHLADVDHRRAVAQEIARERMPEPVRGYSLDARPAARVADDRSHPARLKSAVSARASVKNTYGAPRTGGRMPSDTRRSPRRRRWAAADGRAVGLAVDVDLPGPPIESSSRSRATSTARNPSARAAAGSHSRARPSRYRVSQEARSRSICGRVGNRGIVASRQRATRGTAGASPGSAKPLTAR